MIPNYLRPNRVSDFVVSIYVIVLSRKVIQNHDCVKSVQVQSFFWSIFSPNAGKYETEKTLY